MTRVVADFFSAEFIKFIAVSGLAAVVNFISRILLNDFMGYITAVVCAYIVGMITAFILNKYLVFAVQQGEIQKQAGYFVLVNLIAIVQTVLVSWGLASYILPAIGIQHYSNELAHFIGITVPAFSSFLGHKYLSFSKQ